MVHAANLDGARRSFAAELRVVANVSDPCVVDAFAAVPRERFVGPGPWRILHMFDGYWTTPDADPGWLYHNVLVALDDSRGLNTGEPSLWAHHFDRLGIRAGDRVLQVGAGSGYFTAILAELVGARGRVLGLEVDGALASAAAMNLAAWPQASVRKVEGIVAPDGKWDAIIAFAGATAPQAAWIDALDDGGRALIPITGSERWGFMLRLDRRGANIAARSAGRVGFFPCAGARDDAEAMALQHALRDQAGLGQIKALRRDTHDAGESCWLHGNGWCLGRREPH